MNTLTRLLQDRSGATAVEYGLIISLIGTGLIIGLTPLGSVIGRTFLLLANSLHNG